MAGQSTAMYSEALLQSMRAVIKENRTWFIFLGFVLIALGIVAVAFPFMITIATKIFLGWLFLIGGWLAFFPLTGIVTLTLLLALFIAQGLLEAGVAFRMRPLGGWIWMLVASVIAIAVGVLIIAGLPSSAVWAIGLLVGINMISSSWAYLFLALTAAQES